MDVATDLDGFPRPNGAAYDIGAHEYYDEPPGQGGGGGSGTGGSATGGTAPAALDSPEDDSGCGCRTAGSAPQSSLWLLGLLALGRRRCRRDRVSARY